MRIVAVEYRLVWDGRVLWTCTTRYADGAVNQSFQLAPR